MVKRPSSFKALFPLGYNDLQTKDMKDIPSSFYNININISKKMKEHRGMEIILAIYIYDSFIFIVHE
jgi:hypothetical protein